MISHLAQLYLLSLLIMLSYGCDDSPAPSQSDLSPELLDVGIAQDMRRPVATDSGNDDQMGLIDEMDGSVDQLDETEIQGDLEQASWSGGCHLLTFIDQDQVYYLSYGEVPVFQTSIEQAIPVFLKASALGEYLLYSAEEKYLSTLDDQLIWENELIRAEDEDYSRGEWAFQSDMDQHFVMVHQQSRRVLNLSTQSSEQGVRTGVFRGNRSQAGIFRLVEGTGCLPHPELSLDSEGEVSRTHFDDGDLFGVVDTHSHLFSNLGFGSGVYGAPFHRLGVEHALGSCENDHGEDGELDLWGYFADRGEGGDVSELASAVLQGVIPQFNHHTDGYPTFTDWPNAPYSSTHQTQYYRWIERAWRGGLRLIVQHAVANQVICELQRARHPRAERYECNEMTNVKRSIEATYELERYIDAQFGGEGLGFLKVVTTPEQAREVIGQGKLAVILGIETSNLFDCYATVIPERPSCTPSEVTTRLEELHQMGVRVMFPVHKYDNGFSAGDGARGLLEVANLINTGHWSSYVEDCDLDAPNLFDHGDVVFGGLNKPREQFGGDPAIDMSAFATDPVSALLPVLASLSSDRIEGDYCRNHGLTDLGRHLIDEMIRLGMLIEMDHFSRRSYQEVIQLLESLNYPALGTHGNHFNGRIYALGGVSKISPKRCQKDDQPQAMISNLLARIEVKEAVGAYPAEGFGFDLNGFAGYPKPRFGERSSCRDPQSNPVEYPFSSYAGDVTFTQPRIGERTLDFNTEGLVHLGLFPELIDDLRERGANDEAIEPLFRSAEGYLRMWERAELRAIELNGR